MNETKLLKLKTMHRQFDTTHTCHMTLLPCKISVMKSILYLFLPGLNQNVNVMT